MLEAFLPAAVFLVLYANITILNAYCDAGLTCWFTIIRNPSFFGGHAAGFMRFAICLIWTGAIVALGLWLFFLLVKLLALFDTSDAAALTPYSMLSVMLCMVFARRANSLALHIKEKYYDRDLLDSQSGEVVHAPDMLHNINRYIHSDYNIYQILLRYGWYCIPTVLCLICEPAYRHRDDLRKGLAQYLICRYGVHTILRYFDSEITVGKNTLYLAELRDTNQDLGDEALAFTLLMTKIDKSKMHVTESSIRRFIAVPQLTSDHTGRVQRVRREFLKRPMRALLSHNNSPTAVRLVQRSTDGSGFLSGFYRPGNNLCRRPKAATELWRYQMHG